MNVVARVSQVMRKELQKKAPNMARVAHCAQAIKDLCEAASSPESRTYYNSGTEDFAVKSWRG